MGSPRPPSNPPGYRWSPPGPQGPTRCCAGHSAAHWSSSPAPRVRLRRPPAGAHTSAGTARGQCSLPSAPRCRQGHSGRNWEKAGLPSAAAAPQNECGGRDLLHLPAYPSHSTTRRSRPARTPTAEPRPPNTLRPVPRQGLAGARAPSGLPHRCHSPSDYKKRVFERHVSPRPAGGRAPSPLGLLAGSLRAGKNAPPTPPPSRDPCHHGEPDSQGRKRSLRGRKCGTSALSAAILVVGRDRFLCSRPAPALLHTLLPSAMP